MSDHGYETGRLNLPFVGVSTFANNIVAQGNLDVTGELDVNNGASIDMFR